MLAILGILTISALLYLVMTKKASPVVALIIVPVVTALAGGQGLKVIGYMTEGIRSIAPTGVMFIFAILFFGILTDAGTFRPIIRSLLRVAGNDPARVGVATSLLAMIVHLDGSGAVTFLITIPAFLPVYDALKMKRTTLACIVALSAGTMNILPWGGPTIRAATSLDVPVTVLFNPLLIPVLAGLMSVLFLSYWMGKQEGTKQGAEIRLPGEEEAGELERPRIFWINIALIVLAVATLISGVAPPHVIFMIVFAIAISINYPNLKIQADRINAHAKAAMLMASIIFAAGCFTGILKGSGMIEAMAQAAVGFIPNWLGAHLAVITGVLSMPASLLFDPDSFYFGILPLLATTASHFGGDTIEVGRAAIIGQMTTGFPVSPLTGATFLLTGLTGVDLGDHQRKTIPYAFMITIIILIFSLIVGAITF
jgi:CitMHS family citrate-Mg2+:H+ or citrate-Ca2+:H+ symporter